jgi:hypothetical protein
VSPPTQDVRRYASSPVRSPRSAPPAAVADRKQSKVSHGAPGGRGATAGSARREPFDRTGAVSHYLKVIGTARLRSGDWPFASRHAGPLVTVGDGASPCERAQTEDRSGPRRRRFEAAKNRPLYTEPLDYASRDDRAVAAARIGCPWTIRSVTHNSAPPPSDPFRAGGNRSAESSRPDLLGQRMVIPERSRSRRHDSAAVATARRLAEASCAGAGRSLSEASSVLRARDGSARRSPEWGSEHPYGPSARSARSPWPARARGV